jgi:UrcA family protein
MFKTPLVLAASLLASATFLAGAAGPALAAPPAPAAQTRIVGYADLDLSSAAGRARLDRRVDAAVRAVCGRAAPIDLNGLAQVQACRDETLADATAQYRRGEVFIALAGPAAIEFVSR